MKRRELEPAKAAVKRRPKREMSPFDHVLMRYVVTARYVGHGVEYHPKVTENGHTEQGNPSGALSGDAGAGDRAASPDGVGYPKKRRPRVMPGIC